MFSGSQMPSMLGQGSLDPYLSQLNGLPTQGQGSSALTALYGPYAQAFSQLQPQENAALQQYGIQSGQAKNQAVGNLNARGLTNSLLGTRAGAGQGPTSGYGSGALQNLAQQRLQGQNQLMQGYTNEANSLNNNLLSEAGQTASGFGNLGLQQARLSLQEQGQQPGLLNLFGLGAKAAPLLGMI